MNLVTEIFGQGKDLNTVQMCSRGVVVFLYALVLIRISGRRSFGIRTPMDNIIVILLGAVLSRGVVGASPFIPVMACCLAIVVLHRFFGWLATKSKIFTQLTEGNKILLFDKGKFIKRNMQKALIHEDDIMQGIRKSALTEDLGTIDQVHMERNGEITATRRKNA